MGTLATAAVITPADKKWRLNDRERDRDYAWLFAAPSVNKQPLMTERFRSRGLLGRERKHLLARTRTAGGALRILVFIYPFIRLFVCVFVCLSSVSFFGSMTMVGKLYFFVMNE